MRRCCGGECERERIGLDLYVENGWMVGAGSGMKEAMWSELSVANRENELSLKT